MVVWSGTAPAMSTDHSREARERLLERDAPLRPRQRGTQAKVDAVAEGEVVVERAVDVETVGVGIGALVAAGRAGDHHDLRAGRDRAAVHVDVGGAPAALHR